MNRDEEAGRMIEHNRCLRWHRMDRKHCRRMRRMVHEIAAPDGSVIAVNAADDIIDKLMRGKQEYHNCTYSGGARISVRMGDTRTKITLRDTRKGLSHLHKQEVGGGRELPPKWG